MKQRFSTNRPAGKLALIHIHIPKTAVSSLNEMLRSAFAEDVQIDATGSSIAVKLSGMSEQERAKCECFTQTFPLPSPHSCSFFDAV